MAWIKRGNIRGPTGPQGAASTVPGPTGPTGAIGPVGPGVAPGGSIGQRLTKTGAPDFQTGWVSPMRSWRLAGDNSGDSSNNLSATWSTVKSPVFTAPANGWYQIVANFNAFVGANAIVMALALMIDANIGRMLYFSGTNAYFEPVSIFDLFQLTTGQKVTIGYRPTVNNKVVTFVNSNSLVPLLVVREVDAPA